MDVSQPKGQERSKHCGMGRGGGLETRVALFHWPARRNRATSTKNEPGKPEAEKKENKAKKQHSGRRGKRE